MKKMLLTLAALFAAATSARADLYVTPTGAGNKDGSSWANAFAGIQAAVDAVDAAVAADANYAIPTIVVTNGVYSRVTVSRDMALVVLSPEGFSDRWHPTRNKEALCAEGRMLFLSLYEAQASKLDNATLYRRCHEMGDLAVATVRAKLLGEPPSFFS